MSRRESRCDKRRQSRTRHDTDTSLTTEVRVTLSETTSVARASEHPASCRVCRGCGWAAGPPFEVRQHGETFEQTSVQPCGHKWWWDDPSPELPISFADYVQQLSERAASGDSVALDELTVWRHPRASRPTMSVDV